MTLNYVFGFTGFLGLTSAFILCLSLILLSIMLHTRKSLNFINIFHVLSIAQMTLLGIALLSLNLLLQRNAFEYSVVFNTIESAMPWYQKLGGMWSGQSSSLMFWSFIMSATSLISIYLAKRFSYELYIPSIVLIFECTLIFFILPNVFYFNPFEKIWTLPSGAITQALFAPLNAALLVPADGQGMNPNLRHSAMLLHPPFLYMGLIGLFIPYSFALSSWIQNDQETDWVVLIFPYVLATWTCLTTGMFLGSWWAYTISGWGGYWGWDAVEISGLLPWLLSFGLVHSMRIRVRGKPNMKWIYLFSVGIIIFILFGILVTRSGILESVHAYTSGTMGPALTVLIILHILAVIYFVQKSHSVSNEESTNQFESYIEKLIKWFNVCLLILVAIYLFGQTLPLSSQLILGEKRSFSQSNYKIVSSFPLFILVILAALHPIAYLKDADEKKFKRLLRALIFISAFCPVILLVFSAVNIYTLVGFWAAAFLLCSWLYTFGCRVLSSFFTKFKQKDQVLKKMRLGSIVIHLGFAVMVFGILGVENLFSTYDVYLGEGNKAAVGDFVLLGQTERDYVTENNIVRSEFSITAYTPTGSPSELTPIVEYYPKMGIFHTYPAIYSNLFYDLKIVIHQLPDTMIEKTGLYIAIFPLMSWIWIGGLLMIVGGLFTLFVRGD
jgi:cytochrome c-type biogenesis protein CcmF